MPIMVQDVVFTLQCALGVGKTSVKTVRTGTLRQKPDIGAVHSARSVSHFQFPVSIMIARHSAPKLLGGHGMSTGRPLSRRSWRSVAATVDTIKTACDSTAGAVIAAAHIMLRARDAMHERAAACHVRPGIARTMAC